MSYYTDGITLIDDAIYDEGRLITIRTDHTDKVIQCYVSGYLLAWGHSVGGVAKFVLPNMGESDMIFLLAVDEEDAAVSYWSQAFESAGGRADRIDVRSPRFGLAYRPGDTWQVYLGSVGDSEADELVHDQPVFVAGRQACGYGMSYCGGYGFDGANAAGYGECYGYEYGFDCAMLVYVSSPLPRGEYPVKVVVSDSVGNESIAGESTVTLNTYARPASELAAQSYDSNTDTLTLSFTPSEDIT